MKLVLDEMHAPSVARDLTSRGWDIVSVAAEPELRGMPDADLMTYAARNCRAIVTENIADFSILANEWATKGQDHAEILFTNPSRFDRASLTYPGILLKALDSLLNEPPDPGSSWIHWL